MTIAAISTPPGTGGIAVIRISGPDAVSATDSIFAPHREGHRLSVRPSHSLTFGQIVNPETDEIIDETVVALFRAPHSFTGEDVVEISCHGSVYIQQELLRLLTTHGCRLAEPGEFTRRAFINGKMDLSQAEAVADVIAAESRAAHRLAMNQMRGSFSSELASLREQLVTFASLLELELDFGDHEDLEFVDRSELRTLATAIEHKIATLENSFAKGNAIKHGIPVAIVGETNAGKSTLLNLLVGDERAIVSDIHGTTRDVIEDTVNINGALFRFIDTAGIRQTDDTIENLGIERTYKMIERAEIILWVVDSTCVTEHIEWLAERIVKRAAGKRLIILLNKTENLDSEEIATLREWFTPYDAEKIEISAKYRKNTNTLPALLYRSAQLPEIGNHDVIVTNLRHYEALRLAHAAIRRTLDGLDYMLPADLIAQDVRECTRHLGEITGGEITSDELLSTVFSRFCVGK